MNLLITIFLSFALAGPLTSTQNKQNKIVIGRNFQILETQQIKFVPLKTIDPKLFVDSNIPRQISLRDNQSRIKNQGMRGACTYFTVTGLAESLIKRATNQEVDLSEEYLAWAAKTKKK